MKNLDYLVVLGARIGFDDRGIMQLSRHLALRVDSARIAYHMKCAPKLIISGGPCIGIRYPAELDKPSIAEPDFSDKAREKAARFPSESAVIAMYLNRTGKGMKLPVPWDAIILEQESTTTTENAQEVAKLIDELGGGRAGILSMAYHLLRPRENAMDVFREEFDNFDLPEPIPVFSEEVLCRKNKPYYAPFIERFYQEPWSGYQWPVEEICMRLERNESLMGLQPIKAV